MNEFPAKEPQPPSEALSCFILLYCLLVPIIGTLASLFLLNLINEDLAIAGTACLYLSSVILGLFNVRRFKEYRDRVEYRTLVMGISLSCVCFLIAVAGLIFHLAAVKLRIIS
jgi:hypothetical protein